MVDRKRDWPWEVVLVAGAAALIAVKVRDRRRRWREWKTAIDPCITTQEPGASVASRSSGSYPLQAPGREED